MRAIRRFGGVGMMIQRPAVSVEIRRSADWSATGSLADRALDFAKKIWDTWPLFRRNCPALAVTGDGPPEHTGLGVGTAIGMSVAYGILREFAGERLLNLDCLARSSGRGLRSGIGLHGFELGGFLIDGGKCEDENLPYLLDRVSFPTDWRIVLARPSTPSLWFGERERGAFARPRPAAAVAVTRRFLMEIAFEELFPGLKAADFPSFSRAVYAFNRTAGEPFADDQGGPYVGPAVSELIDKLRAWGVVGVGQSSWGPTVFAFAADQDEANVLAGRIRSRFPDIADVTVTSANNSGFTASDDRYSRNQDPDQPDQEHVRRQHEQD
jgi:beta-RFAP synthase